jgi:hypothetical protein
VSDISVLKIDDDTIPVYNKSTIVDLFIDCFKLNNKDLTLPIDNIANDNTITNNNLNISDIIEHIEKYNSKKLREHYVQELKNYMSSNEIKNLLDPIKSHILSIYGRSQFGPARTLSTLEATLNNTEKLHIYKKFIENIFLKENTKHSLKRDWRNVYDSIEKHIYDENQLILNRAKSNAINILRKRPRE